MKRKQIIIPLLVLTLILSSLSFFPSKAFAAKKPKLSKTKITLTVGKTYKLKVKNNKKKVTWKSSNKKIATVSSNGKIKAKKAGATKITAKIKGKKLVCKVIVQNSKKKSTTEQNNSQPTTQTKKFSVTLPNLDTCGTFTDANQEYELTNIRVTWTYNKTFNDNNVRIYFSGYKTGDTFSNTHNFPITIHYKFYNSNNAIVASGFAMTPSICVGDYFENVTTIVSLNMPNDAYRVEIENS